MRILHVSDCYLPRLGGIETQVHHLARQQHLAGDDVRVLTATPRARGDLTREETVDGVRVIRATADLPFELPVHPQAAAQVRRVLQEAQDAATPYDVAHVHTGVVSPFAYAALPVLIEHQVPVVVTVHSMWGPAAAGFALLDKLCHWTHWPIVISAVSSVAAEPIRQRGPRSEVMVIPNGLDLNQWLAAEPALPVLSGDQAHGESPKDDVVVMVAVMRLAPRKRALALLRALRQVRDRLDPAIRIRVLMIGDGPLRSALQRYLDHSGMSDWVELTGRWPRDRIRDVYRDAAVFIAPARLESFGIAALEARASGVPVVAFKGTGVGEFVTDGVDGRLVADDAQLVTALLELAENPDIRRRLSAGARDTSPTDSSWPAVLEQCRLAYAAAVTVCQAAAE